MNKIKSVISWGTALLLLLIGFAGIVAGDVLSGLSFGGIALLFTPYFDQLYLKKFPTVLPKVAKVFLGVALFFAAGFFATPPKNVEATEPTPTPIVQEITPSPTGDVLGVESSPSALPIIEQFFTPEPSLLSSPSLVPTPQPTPKPSPIPTPKPTPVPSPVPTPIPSPKPKPTPQQPSPIMMSIQPSPQAPQGGWVCNCAKTCPQMSSCAEAQYQLNNCGCGARDADKDGIACDADCQ